MHSTLLLISGFRLAVLLAILPLTSATPSPSQPLDFRNAVIQRDSKSLPGGWFHVGCYVDNLSRPVLTGFAFSKETMSIGLCVSSCIDEQKNYAGLENGNFCYCGNVLTVDSIETRGSECSDGTNCAGDHTEKCGASLRLDLYRSSAPAQHPPTIIQTVDWTSLGCVRDTNHDDRILPFQATDVYQFDLTVEYCLTACNNHGYDTAGVEFARECWCGSGGLPAHAQGSNDCVLACPMNSTEICGGANALVVYQRH